MFSIKYVIRNTLSVSQRKENWSIWIVCRRLLLNEMPNMSRGTFKVVSPYKHIVTIVLSKRKIEPVDILFYDKPEALINVEWYEMYRHQEHQGRYLFKSTSR